MGRMDQVIRDTMYFCPQCGHFGNIGWPTRPNLCEMLRWLKLGIRVSIRVRFMVRGMAGLRLLGSSG